MKISCGIIILNQQNEILMGHVTGNKFYDIPKGELDAGETPIVCAIRECQEEISLEFKQENLIELGLYPYNKEKNLHLFITHVEKSDIDFNKLACHSFFEHYHTKKQTPEVDGFAWIAVLDVVQNCAKSMGKLLTQLNNDRLLEKKPHKSKKL